MVVHKSEAVRLPLRVRIPHINPHLHLPLTHHVIPVARRHWRSHWHHVWAFSEWATLHRGLGTVEGIVHNGAGEPMAGIRVALRNAAGGVLRSVAARHITYTGEGGAFLMTAVRTGSYRVRATRGKAVGHVSIRVGAGRMVMADIKL
jgi:hypothetical protein